jgi:hypothetical protein
MLSNVRNNFIFKKNSFFNVLAGMIIACSLVPVICCQVAAVTINLDAAKITRCVNELKGCGSTIADKIEIKVKAICNTHEKIYLKKFGLTNKDLVRKLLSIVGLAINQYIQALFLENNNIIIALPNGDSIIASPEAYLDLKEFIIKGFTGKYNPLSPSTESYKSDEVKDALIDALLSPYVKQVVGFINIYIHQSAIKPKNNIFESTMTYIKQLIAIHITKQELSSLKSFLDSSACQKIQSHLEEFKPILLPLSNKFN